MWRVVSRSAARVEISLLTCDGGQEMDRLTSADPAVLDFIGVRSGSDGDVPDVDPCAGDDETVER